MKAGDPVVYTGPFLFAEGDSWTGVVVRMPLSMRERSNPPRIRDTRVLVQRSGEVRANGQPLLHAVVPGHLKVIRGKPNIPLKVNPPAAPKPNG